MEAAGRRAVVVQLDQSDPVQVERLFREFREALGTPWHSRIGSGPEGRSLRPFYCCGEFIRCRRAAGDMVLTSVTQPAVDDSEMRDQQVRNIPWKRAAEPREIALLAVYLASDDADYATGQSFMLGGGLMMNMAQGA